MLVSVWRCRPVRIVRLCTGRGPAAWPETLQDDSALGSVGTAGRQIIFGARSLEHALLGNKDAIPKESTSTVAGLFGLLPFQYSAMGNTLTGDWSRAPSRMRFAISILPPRCSVRLHGEPWHHINGQCPLTLEYLQPEIVFHAYNVYLGANNHSTNSIDGDVLQRLSVDRKQNVAHVDLSRAAPKNEVSRRFWLCSACAWLRTQASGSGMR